MRQIFSKDWMQNLSAVKQTRNIGHKNYIQQTQLLRGVLLRRGDK